MSLINQMLQELDARRAEVAGANAYGTHIRAVPERRRMHAAWWVALSLAIVLAVVVAWIVTRPAPAPVITLPQAQLPLRLSADMDVSQVNPQVSTQQPAMSGRITATPPAAERQAPTPETLALPETSSAEATLPEMPPKAEEKRPAQVTPILVAAVAPPPKEATAQQHAQPPVKAAQMTGPQNANDIISAVAAQKQVRELTPRQRADNEYRTATMQIQQGRKDEAAASLERALQLDGYHVAARQALIGMLLDAKRQDEAMRKAKDGLDLDGAQTGLAMILARLQLEKGELKPAIETLERSQSHASEKPDYQSFLAALLQRDNRNKEAAELYLRVVQRAPQNGVWWMGLGISLQAENRLNEAQEAFGRAKATNSLSPELVAFVDAKLRQLQR